MKILLLILLYLGTQLSSYPWCGLSCIMESREKGYAFFHSLPICSRGNSKIISLSDTHLLKLLKNEEIYNLSREYDLMQGEFIPDKIIKKKESSLFKDIQKRFIQMWFNNKE
jgi:hypothetical protein